MWVVFFIYKDVHPFILLVHYPQVMLIRLIPEANLRCIIQKLGLGLFIALQGVSYELRHGLPARSPCV
jgi:hypothetical protein